MESSDIARVNYAGSVWRTVRLSCTACAQPPVSDITLSHSWNEATGRTGEGEVCALHRCRPVRTVHGCDGVSAHGIKLQVVTATASLVRADRVMGTTLLVCMTRE